MKAESDFVGDGLPGPHGNSQIESDEAPNKIEKLQPQGFIDAVTLLQVKQLKYLQRKY